MTRSFTLTRACGVFTQLTQFPCHEDQVSVSNHLHPTFFFPLPAPVGTYPNPSKPVRKRSENALFMKIPVTLEWIRWFVEASQPNSGA